MTRLNVGGGDVKTQKRAVVSLAASGVVIAAVTGKRLKVYAYSMQSRLDAMTVQLTNGNGGANLSRLYTLNLREKETFPIGVPLSYYFATTAGVALYAVLAGGIGPVDIEVNYWDDDAG